MERYRVSILAAGGGSRFNTNSDQSHKAIFRVGNKAVISHIIDLFPENITLVIALGHNGHLIEQYLKMFHSKRRFIYVKSENYGPGYGPGYSLQLCKYHLQLPFYSFACDTIVDGFSLDETSNWAGYCGIDREDANQYCTLQINNQTGLIEEHFDKKETGTDIAWIGLAFIRDYEVFWDSMDRNIQFINEEKQLSPALFSLSNIKGRHFPKWYDTGNERGLKFARSVFKGLVNLDKTGEEIYFTEESVIKYFYNEEIIKNRIARTQFLGDLVPKIEGNSDNFYRYSFIPGKDLTRIKRPDRYIETLLEFSHLHLWRDILLNENEKSNFQQLCNKFYRVKTRFRLQKLFNKLGIEDEECIINNTRIPTLNEIFNCNMDWNELCDGLPSMFHGDFNMSNIILTKNNSFKFVDWRQDFGGNVPYGDRYYDLAKLYQSFIWPYTCVRNGLFDLQQNKSGEVQVSINIPESLDACSRILESWSVSYGYDIKKIKILAALTLLNISPLHEAPLDIHLYYLGRYNLYKFLER